MADKETVISNTVDSTTTKPFLTWTNSVHSTSTNPSSITLTVRTNDPVHYTNANVQYWIKATLDNYLILYPTEATQWHPFNINI
jgi:hypothetical protein